jgi:hypothetical protein
MFVKQDLPRLCSVVGLSMCLVGGFLLSVEALRLVRFADTVEKLKEFGRKGIIGPQAKPLPFTWQYASMCLTICLVSWIWAPYLVLWTLTPALFVMVFLLYQILKWSVVHSDDGFAALVGFVFLTLGTGFQLAGVLLN